MKTRISILIDEAILKEAQECGLNISQTCEYTLKEITALIKSKAWFGRQTHNLSENLTVSALPSRGQDCQVGDLEVEGSNPSPGIQSMPGIVVDKVVDWNAFEDYLLKGHDVRVARDYVSYAQKWIDCLRSGDLSKVLVLSPGRRRMVMASLSALAKFLGAYQDWQQLTKRYSLKWAGRSSTDIILERFQKVKDPNEIFDWIKQVKEERPELSDFIDLMAITGMRMVEAFNCYNMIIQLSKEGKIIEYYKDQTLEHYKFKDVFIRGNKKIFISFTPEQLINRIAKNEPLNSWMSVQKLVTKQGLPSRFSDVREAHATFFTKYLKDSEIDFLHGRVSTNVFMRNYFNPALIVDLKTRVFQAIQEIEAKIK